MPHCAVFLSISYYIISDIHAFRLIQFKNGDSLVKEDLIRFNLYAKHKHFKYKKQITNIYWVLNVL